MTRAKTTANVKNKYFIAAKRGLATIALWQFVTFFLLLVLVWVNEILDLPNLLYGLPKTPPNISGALLLSICVILTAIITVGYTYIAQRRILSGFLTVCSKCHRVKLDEEAWQQIESYISQHSRVIFTHGLCPECYDAELEQLKKDFPEPGNPDDD